MPQGGGLASFDENHYRNDLKSVCVLLIVQENICWVKIPNQQLHDSHTRSPIAGTMPVPTLYFSMINSNIMNSQHSPSCMNMNDVIIK